MIAVMMRSAKPGRRRLDLEEAVTVSADGVRQRAGGHFPGDWERTHAKVMFPVRIAIALWLCFVSAMLIAYRRGQPWLILLIPAIAAHIYIAYRIRPDHAQL